MITRTVFLLLVSIAASLFSQRSTALAQSSNATALAQSSNATDQAGVVYLHETFDSYEVDGSPTIPQLQRCDKVTVTNGSGKVGEGKVARFDDSDASAGGAMEYNFGESALGALYIEFDALNNDAAKGNKSSVLVFGVGSWGRGKGLALNAKAKRAFGFEMYQQKYLKLRVGDDAVASVKYDASAAFNIKIWANDNDTNSLSYKRPDNGEEAALNPDSVVVWMNNAIFGELTPAGTPMHGKVTRGDAMIGRVGLSSSSTKVCDFLIDNLHVEDPSTEPKDDSKTSKTKSASPATSGEVTHESLPGAETMRYRNGENAMNLHVFKPEGWQAEDRRSAFIYFFGGGWTKGTPQKSASTAAWAARNGMVGIAPDYRTKNRFGTSPLASVDDARAAFSWVLDNAEKLGIDPNRVAVGGSSAGGHVALWTSIEKAPPGSDPATSPKPKPAALFLTSAVTDTSPSTGYTPKRFGENALALSPVHQLDPKMPATLMFHAAFDDLVHYSTAVALQQKMQSSGNECQLVTVPTGGHGFSKDYPAWKMPVRTELKNFFERNGLLPAIQ